MVQEKRTDQPRTLILGGTRLRAEHAAREAGLKRPEWIWVNNVGQVRGRCGTFNLIDLGPSNGYHERERYNEAVDVLDFLQALEMLTVARRTAVPA